MMKALRVLFLFLMFVCIPKNIESQNVTYQTLFSNSSFESKPVNTNLAVGSIEGSSTVSQGIANYRIPLQLPAGTNNVTPSLSVMYQSHGVDGLIGTGWSLIGLSAITRNLSSFYHDGFVGP